MSADESASLETMDGRGPLPVALRATGKALAALLPAALLIGWGLEVSPAPDAPEPDDTVRAAVAPARPESTSSSAPPQPSTAVAPPQGAEPEPSVLVERPARQPAEPPSTEPVTEQPDQPAEAPPPATPLTEPEQLVVEPGVLPDDVLSELLTSLGTDEAELPPPPPLVHPFADQPSGPPTAGEFGDPRPGGRLHEGIDLPARKGRPVFAVADGTVLWVHDEAGGDCCDLALLHDGGWRSRYIHLDNDSPGTDDGQAVGIAPGLRPGVEVQAGQVIGWVGDSGNAEATIPHLHFELRTPSGRAVDPAEFLDAAGRVQVQLGQ